MCDTSDKVQHPTHDEIAAYAHRLRETLLSDVKIWLYAESTLKKHFGAK